MSEQTSTKQALDGFAAICTKQLALYERLLTCFDQKEQAIRAARIDGLQQIAAQETVLLRELKRIDHQRRLQHGALLRGSNGVESSELLEHLDPDQRDAIQPIIAQLRAVAERVKRRSAVLRSAAETLSAHLTGIVRTAWGAIEQNAVYERSGRVATGGANLGIDVKS